MLSPQPTEFTFEDILFRITRETNQTIWAFARTLEDPWEYISSVLEDVSIATEELPEFHSALEDFQKQAAVFLETVDASLVTKYIVNHEEDKWHTEYDPNAETRFLSYRPQDFRRDVKDLRPQKEQANTALAGTVAFITEDRTKTSREQWRRAIEGAEFGLRILTEYGNFDLGITDKAYRATLRVRHSTRLGVPYLSVGAVQINMNTGRVTCGVVGCKHTGLLSHLSEEDHTAEEIREWQEYQVLRIIKHLGTHDRKSLSKAFPLFISEVSQHRTTDEDKLLSHLEYCNESKCICHQVILGGWVGMADASVVVA